MSSRDDQIEPKRGIAPSPGTAPPGLMMAGQKGNGIGDLIFGVEGVADIVSYTLNGEIESLTSSYEEFFMLQEVDISGDQ